MSTPGQLRPLDPVIHTRCGAVFCARASIVCLKKQENMRCFLQASQREVCVEAAVTHISCQNRFNTGWTSDTLSWEAFFYPAYTNDEAQKVIKKTSDQHLISPR